MQNLAMKKSALQSLIKELAMLPEEDSEGGLHVASGLNDNHAAGIPGGKELDEFESKESAPSEEAPSGDVMPKVGEEVEDQTVPAETEALEAVKGVDLDHDDEIEDTNLDNSPIKKAPSISEKMKFDDLSLDELKGIKAALQAKGLL